MLDDSVEEWRASGRVEGNYEVSNLGRVRRATPGKTTYAGRLLKPQRTGQPGYLYVYLWVGKRLSKRPVKHYVHTLVAEAFLGPSPTPLHEVNHRDGNRLNNRIGNLEWVTHAENVAHARSIGHYSPPPVRWGEANNKTVLTARQVRAIRRVSREFTQTEVAEVLGISQTTVSNIRARRNWKHLV